MTVSSSVNLSLLRSNLREIAAFRCSDTLSLVANWNATKVYAQHSWLGHLNSNLWYGRIVTWLNRLVAWAMYQLKLREEYPVFDIPEDPVEKIQKALHSISQAFDQAVSEAQQACADYYQFYLTEAQSKPVDKEGLIQTRQKIVLLAETILPIRNLYFDKSFYSFNQKLNQALSFSKRLKDEDSFLQLNKVQQVVNLEGQMEKEIPIKALIALCTDQLSTIDIGDLKKWIKRLNQLNLKIGQLESLLTSLTEMINASLPKSIQPAYLAFKLELFEYPCTLFKKKDDEHSMWQASHLKIHQVVEGSEMNWTIQKELDTGLKMRRLYATQDPNHWLVTGPSALELNIWKFRMQGATTCWGFKPVEIIYHSPDGRYAIIKNPGEMFKNWTWTVRSFNFQPKEDERESGDVKEQLFLEEKRALVVANYLYLMIQQGFIPNPLVADHLAFSSDGLTVLEPPAQRSFDYNSFERFILDISKGNRWVAKFLMTVSSLRGHPISDQYYLPLVEHALLTGESNILGTPIPYGYESQIEVLRKQAELLCNKAATFRAECLEQVKTNLINQQLYDNDEEELLLTVSKELAEVYKEFGVRGTLLDGVKDCTIERLKSNFKGTVRSQHDAQKAEIYYKERFKNLQTK